MFNNDEERTSVPVRLALTDGRLIEGNLMLPVSTSVKRILNSDGAAVEFQNEAGAASLIAKSAIVEIMLTAAAKAQKAPAAQPVGDAPAPEPAADPYAALGLAASATADQTRAAFEALRQEYMPDRFAAMGLPADVIAFIGARSQRIHDAYATLGANGADVPLN